MPNINATTANMCCSRNNKNNEIPNPKWNQQNCARIYLPAMSEMYTHTHARTQLNEHISKGIKIRR